MTCLWVGDGKEAEPVGSRGVGDVDLRPVDHPVVAIANGAGPNVRHIRASIRLRHGNCRHHLAPNRRDQVLLLELFATEAVKRWCRHVRVHRNAGHHPDIVCSPELLA